MKTLITGASGFLGSHICHRFHREGHDVTILRRPESNMSLVEGLGLREVVGDIRDLRSMEQAVEGQDAVVHAAALGGQRSKELLDGVNVAGTQNVVAACKSQNVPSLLHVSSVVAIATPTNRDHPSNENTPLGTEKDASNYQSSKRGAEKVVLSADGLEVIVVNPSWVFGAYGNRFRGRELIDKVINKKLVPYARGGINAVHVLDVAEGVLSALEGGRSGERYILGSQNVSYREIAEIAGTSAQNKPMLVPLPYVVTGIAAVLSGLIEKVTGQPMGLTWADHLYINEFHFYDSSKAEKELLFAPRPFKNIVDEYLTFVRG